MHFVVVSFLILFLSLPIFRVFVTLDIFSVTVFHVLMTLMIQNYLTYQFWSWACGPLYLLLAQYSLSLSLQVILHQSVTFADGILILYFDMFYMQMYSKLKVYIRFSKIYESMWYHRSFLYPLKSSESFWL